MSKKEQKKKELEDLDAMLAELGINVPAAVGDGQVRPIFASRGAKRDQLTRGLPCALPKPLSEQGEGKNKKKKKQEKKKEGGDQEQQQPEPAPQQEDENGSELADAAAIKAKLLAEAKKKASAAKTAGNAALAKAQQAAKDRAKQKKKGADKVRCWELWTAARGRPC